MTHTEGWEWGGGGWKHVMGVLLLAYTKEWGREGGRELGEKRLGEKGSVGVVIRKGRSGVGEGWNWEGWIRGGREMEGVKDLYKVEEGRSEGGAACMDEVVHGGRKREKKRAGIVSRM